MIIDHISSYQNKAKHTSSVLVKFCWRRLRFTSHLKFNTVLLSSGSLIVATSLIIITVKPYIVGSINMKAMVSLEKVLT